MSEIWKDGIYIDENGNVLILNGIQVSNTEKLRKNGKTSKSVCQYDMNDNYITTFPSMSEAERCGYKSSYICKVCKGQLPYAYGFKWRYAS